ncbi:hypothetical protein ABZO31_10330 [Streptomyces sp. HUAS MG47]|uniref:DUF3592 domain-containing protein n=1 Tax=Streptomyces solicamelliae TaxID=3231716 RepID=UPI003878422C
MSISSSVPVLRGDQGTELRSVGEELLLRRPDAELRIPLTAIARVHAERRELAVELTAPVGAEPTVYRVTDVSAAAAGVFADAVNAALPERAADGEPADGSALVVTRSLVIDDDEEEDADENDVRVGMPSKGAWLMYTGFAAVAVLAVVVGLIDGDWGRAIATLLLGAAGVRLTHFAVMTALMVWREWYLPRYGITVDGRQIFREDHGDTAHAFTSTDGVTRRILGHNKGKTVRIAYHPRDPAYAIICSGTGDRVLTVIVCVVVAAFAGLLDYGTYQLVLPAF